MNRGGVIGAWIADALFYLFGFSAWWWVALAALAILRLYRRVEAWELISRRYARGDRSCGFALLLAASCTLEALRLHGASVALPRSHRAGCWAPCSRDSPRRAFGFTGATLLLLAADRRRR